MDTPEQIRLDAADELALLREIYEDGSKDVLMWYKSLVYLMLRLSRANLIPEIEAILILFPSDNSYFRDVLPDEMKSDKLFSDAVMELVQFMVRTRMVDMTYEPSIPLTQFVVGQA